ncbi:MAG: exo-alpha-sialidase [Planctomycetes bacterium]|nr:exo-alpha-sialidase [Planctomycetota bacterium]
MSRTSRPALRPLPAARLIAVLSLALAASADAQQVDHTARVPRETLRDAPSGLQPADPSLPRAPAIAFAFGPYTSTQVNVDGAGLDIVGDAANEPSLVVNPTDPENLVVGWRQFDSIASDFREAGLSYSFDGGASWTFPGVLENGNFRSDPVLDAASDGTLYYQSIHLEPNGDILVDVFRSSDGGVTWSAPVPEFGGDKNWMAVDRTGGPGDGFVYGIWQPFFDCCNGDTLTRSVDGALSFQTPVAVASKPLFGTMTVGGDGTLFMTGVEGLFGQDFDTVVLARSTNAQNGAVTPTSTAVHVDLGGGLTSSTGPNPSGLLGQIDVAVDASGGPFDGRVYVLASVDPNGGFGFGPTEVRVAASRNGGLTFAPSVRVNDDPPGNGAWHWLAAVDVAPDGRVDAVWYDTRDSGQQNVCQLYYAWSHDGGAHWSTNVPVSPAFDSWVGWPQQSKMGDYIDIRSGADGADVAYTATFTGGQDVYHTRVFPLGTITDLGHALAGSAGVPSLVASGALFGGTPTTLALSSARPNAAAGLFLGLSRIDAPFKGGVLVPSPDVVITGISTDAGGTLDIAFDWPVGLPSGLDVWVQEWIVDPVGVAGFAASNGVQLTSG